MKTKVLLLKDRKPVFCHIYLEQVLDLEGIYYYVAERSEDGDDHIGIVFQFDELYVHGYDTWIKIFERDDAGTFLKNIKDTFLSNIASSNLPSLLDIRVYQQLGLDADSLIAKRKDYLLNEAVEIMQIEYSFLQREDITGHDFVRMCHSKGIKIPQDIFGVLGWSTPLIAKDKFYFKNSVSKDMQLETGVFIVKILKKLTKSRQNYSFVKRKDALGNPTYWINGCSFEMLEEGIKCCGVYPNPDYKVRSASTYGKKYICELRSNSLPEGFIKKAFDFLPDAKSWGRDQYLMLVN